MKKRRVRVFAPATIANLGSGYDVLGLAIERPGDIVVAERTEVPGLQFTVKTRKSDVPSGSHQNVASHVAMLMLEEFKLPFGIRLHLYKQMPIGSGLGSSAASSVAAVVAVNALLPNPLKKTDLLRFAVEGERLATGSPHADNVAPSLFGGACIIRSYSPLDIVHIPLRNTITWVVVHPHAVVPTKTARKILPNVVRLQTAIQQWGNVAGLTVGLTTGNAELVGRCVEDEIVEPVRGNLIPGFHKVKEAAMRAGALGCSISGSGPSMFAVAASKPSAERISKAMKRAFSRYGGVSCDVFISRVNQRGAVIIDK